MIPSWNNLPYLKLCIKSIQKHSQIPSQIIIHINDGKDGSLEWARENKIDHTHSQDNIGVCRALNAASTLAQGLYCLPE
ncbi:MAG: glycosyltransferase family A protein [Bacteroidia bacterium]